MSDWTEEYNVNDLGLAVGHVAAVSSIRRKKKKQPFGFAAPARRTSKQIGGRVAGSWPEVPRFDLP